MLHLYGTGLGDLQQVLLERPALEHLHVHVLNGALFAQVLEQLDQTPWLSDSRVELCYAADCADIQFPFFALPAELELADGLNAKIRDRLISEVHLSFNNRHFDPQSPEILQRLQENLERVRGDADVAELFDTQVGREIYVIGTGPTLEQHFTKLLAIRAQSPRPLFISVDTAYRPLLEHGIKPDLVVTVDKNISVRHLPLADSDLPLVYVPMSAPDVLQAGGVNATPLILPARCMQGCVSRLAKHNSMLAAASCTRRWIWRSKWGLHGSRCLALTSLFP